MDDNEFDVNKKMPSKISVGDSSLYYLEENTTLLGEIIWKVS